MDTDIQHIMKNLNNMQINSRSIMPSTNNLDSLILSMNKLKIGKNKINKNTIINKIYKNYNLYSLLNSKLIMDNIYSPVLIKYLKGPANNMLIIKEDESYDADDNCSITEIIE